MVEKIDLITLRTMREEDISWVQQLALSTPEIHFDPKKPKCDDREEWIEVIGGNECTAVVAEFMGHGAGFASSFLGADTLRAEIAEIVVDHSLRRLFIGTNLLTETLDRLRQLGTRYVDALVRFDNAAGAAFLNTHGFEINDRLTPGIFDVYEKEL